MYAQNDTLLLADVFENFRNNCLEIYELDPIYFVSAAGLAWQAFLKKTGVKLELKNWWLKKVLGVEFAKQHVGMLKQIIYEKLW